MARKMSRRRRSRANSARPVDPLDIARFAAPATRLSIGPIVDLSTSSRHSEAVALFTSVINGIHGAIDELNVSQGYRKTVPDKVELWRGIYDGSTLVAAIHIAPAWAYADVWRASPGGPAPAFIADFMLSNPLIQELAVAPGHQDRGLGRALLEDAEQSAKAGRARTLHGFLSTDDDAGALKFYRACGYTVGSLNQPVPQHIIGIPMIHDSCVSGDGYWFYKTL